MLTTITDVYDEIKSALGEFAGDFNIPAIADATLHLQPCNPGFDPSPVTSFWSAVEANANPDTKGR